MTRYAITTSSERFQLVNKNGDTWCSSTCKEIKQTAEEFTNFINCLLEFPDLWHVEELTD